MPTSVPDDELERYRATRRRREIEHREWQCAVKQDAMQSAERVAQFLKDRFGVECVMLFGSVAEDEVLGPRSDLDVAVKGLSAMAYYRAVARVQSFAARGRVDLVRLEQCSPSLRRTIEEQGIDL
jgi:predicted nucleotidyltransferase